jgi:hypothetical protein
MPPARAVGVLDDNRDLRADLLFIDRGLARGSSNFPRIAALAESGAPFWPTDMLVLEMPQLSVPPCAPIPIWSTT